MKKVTWIGLVGIAIFGFISIYRLLLPAEFSYADIPIAAKINTAVGVLGFFIASSGLGLMIAALSDAFLRLIRRERPHYGRIAIATIAVSGGVLMVSYYWNWLSAASGASGS